MIVVQGKGISAGTAHGRLHCFHRVGAAAAKSAAGDPEQELARLVQARQETKEQIAILTERCRQEAGADAALVFAAHEELIEDAGYIGDVSECLRQKRCTAEYAVQRVGAGFFAMFESVDDPYMRARAADIWDVTWRLLRNLAGAGFGGAMPEGPAILAADYLTPSEFMELDRDRVLAVASRQGSYDSHAAILARLLRIPAVCGLGDRLQPEFHGRVAWVDGTAGTLMVV